MSCFKTSAAVVTKPVVKLTLVSVQCRGQKYNVFIDLPYENGKAKMSIDLLQKMFSVWGMPEGATVSMA